MIFGRTRSICRSSQFSLQVASSSTRGTRLCGGRHLTAFVRNTRCRGSPSVASISSTNWPARPTNGRPAESSCAPGASPTNMTRALYDPSPGTACVRLSQSRHFVHTRMDRCNRSRRTRRSRSVTLNKPHVLAASQIIRTTHARHVRGASLAAESRCYSRSPTRPRRTMIPLLRPTSPANRTASVFALHQDSMPRVRRPGVAAGNAGAG